MIEAIEFKKQDILQPADLSDDSVQLEWRHDGKLWVKTEDIEVPVDVFNCFPWSEPGRFISLRDSDGKEVVLLEDLTELNEDSRRALEQALIETSFVLEIIGVETIAEDFEIRTWKVMTRQGKRSFQTKLDDWPYQLPDGGMLIRDVSGDLFYVPDPSALDQESQKKIWAFTG